MSMSSRRVCREKNNVLKANPCKDCGKIFPSVCMQWDHRPEEDKIEAVNGFVQRGDMLGMILEIKKCDLVCANCHAIRSHVRGMSHEHKKKISNSMKKIAKEIANRPEVIAKKSAALKGRKRSPEIGKKISASFRKKRAAPTGVDPVPPT